MTVININIYFFVLYKIISWIYLSIFLLPNKYQFHIYIQRERKIN